MVPNIAYTNSRIFKAIWVSIEKAEPHKSLNICCSSLNLHDYLTCSIDSDIPKINL